MRGLLCQKRVRTAHTPGSGACPAPSGLGPNLLAGGKTAPDTDENPASHGQEIQTWLSSWEGGLTCSETTDVNSRGDRLILRALEDRKNLENSPWFEAAAAGRGLWSRDLVRPSVAAQLRGRPPPPMKAALSLPRPPPLCSDSPPLAPRRAHQDPGLPPTSGQRVLAPPHGQGPHTLLQLRLSASHPGGS